MSTMLREPWAIDGHAGSWRIITETGQLVCERLISRAVADHIVHLHNSWLGSAFERWMRAEDWTVVLLSQELKVSRSTIYGWIKGRWAPSDEALAALGRLSGGAVSAAMFGGGDV